MPQKSKFSGKDVPRLSIAIINAQGTNTNNDDKELFATVPAFLTSALHLNKNNKQSLKHSTIQTISSGENQNNFKVVGDNLFKNCKCSPRLVQLDDGKSRNEDRNTIAVHKTSPKTNRSYPQVTTFVSRKSKNIINEMIHNVDKAQLNSGKVFKALLEKFYKENKTNNNNPYSPPLNVKNVLKLKFFSVFNQESKLWSNIIKQVVTFLNPEWVGLPFASLLEQVSLGVEKTFALAGKIVQMYQLVLEREVNVLEARSYPSLFPSTCLIQQSENMDLSIPVKDLSCSTQETKEQLREEDDTCTDKTEQVGEMQLPEKTRTQEKEQAETSYSLKKCRSCASSDESYLVESQEQHHPGKSSNPAPRFTIKTSARKKHLLYLQLLANSKTRLSKLERNLDTIEAESPRILLDYTLKASSSSKPFTKKSTPLSEPCSDKSVNSQEEATLERSRNTESVVQQPERSSVHQNSSKTTGSNATCLIHHSAILRYEQYLTALIADMESLAFNQAQHTNTLLQVQQNHAFEGGKTMNNENKTLISLTHNTTVFDSCIKNNVYKGTPEQVGKNSSTSSTVAESDEKASLKKETKVQQVEKQHMQLLHALHLLNEAKQVLKAS